MHKMKHFCFIVITLFGLCMPRFASSTKSQNNKICDWDIYKQNKEWIPSITSGPTILVASNVTTIHDQNGNPIDVQLSNNNVGIGKSSFNKIE